MKFDPWQKFPTTQYVVTTFEFGYYLMQQVVGIMFSSYRCYYECLPLNVMISWKPRNVSILDFCHCASEDLQLITSSNSGRCFHGAEVEMMPLWLSYSTESSIITLESCGVHTKKYSKIHCPIKEDETWMTFNNTSQCLRQLR